MSTLSWLSQVMPDSCHLFGTPDHLEGPTPKSKIALTTKRGMVLPSIGRTFLIICVADVGVFNQVVVSGKMGVATYRHSLEPYNEIVLHI